MATSALEPTTPVQHVQHERFTTKQHGYELWYLSLDLSGNIAVSGYHSSRRTYIDLYSGSSSDSRGKLKLFYSKEFENDSDFPYVSHLNKSVSKLVICIEDKIEIIDTENEFKELRFCEVNGWIRCLAVREEKIFIGLRKSQTLLVFDNDLKERKKIRIKGIPDGDYPCDLQVIKDTIFVCTAYLHFRALSVSVYDGSIVSEYTDTTGMYGRAKSIAVGEEINLVAVLWSKYPKTGIIFYSLSKTKCFLVFDVDNDVTRIRISDRDRMLITGNEKTGEIKLYDLEQLFSFEAMKKTLALLVFPKEYEKLRKYFRVTEEEIRRLEAGDEDNELSDKQRTVRKMECLLTVIEEKGHLNPYNVNKVTDAVSKLGDTKRISDLRGPMEGYSLHSSNIQTTVKGEMARKKAWEDESSSLNDQEREKSLNDLQNEQTQEQEQREDLKIRELKIKELEGQRMTLTEALQQSSYEIQTLKAELEQIQLKSTKEIETLTEELKQSKTESNKQIEILTEELKQSKAESDRQIKTLTEELKQRKRESDRQIETLTKELKQTKAESDRQTETLTEELQQSKAECDIQIETLTDELKQTKQSKTESDRQIEALTEELKQSQTESDRQIETLTEGLQWKNQSKAVTEEGLTQRSMESKPSVNSEETRDIGVAVLAAEFGRLTVAIAEHLTLDDCLKLATFCNIPLSDCDTVLRVSMTESPGMKFLDILKKRNVINMFDVTHLKKALAMMQMEAVYHDLVAPYQDRIDKEWYELYKVEEIYARKEIDAFANVAKDVSAQMKDVRTSLIDDTKPEYSSQSKAAAQPKEARDEGRRPLLEGRHHQLYTEHSIGREGGTIQLANVSLIIPPDALHESHVIALSVMNEFPFPLDREVDMARMTPLIKLQPLGLKFKKSLQLNIPHSALISEPEHHDVIIYSGQITKDNGDCFDSIKWTEDKSIQKQLKEKSVTADIQCLTYLSASLFSRTSSPTFYMLRAVPFVDGVRNTDDDIILTICFCSDNDAEYNMLLSDYKTKLPLEQYSTIQLCRRQEKDEDDAGYLSVTVTSRNNSYVPDADQAVKFSISHLCTASRVSKQLRLQKNREIDRDDVQVFLTFSQAGSSPTEIFMKARIKDLMISQESEDLLIGSVSTAVTPYNELKEAISSMLESHHCIQLAAYFDLTPAEAERITIDASPGRILVKILDEREKIMPQKMFGLYRGLKVCHLDKIARIVFEYIEENSNETQVAKHENEKDTCTKGVPENASPPQRSLQKHQNRRSLIDKSVQTTITAAISSSDSVLKMINQELFLDGDRTSDTLSITHRPSAKLKWIKNHRGFMRNILPMFVDGILQIQRGVFTLPRGFQN